MLIMYAVPTDGKSQLLLLYNNVVTKETGLFVTKLCIISSLNGDGRGWGRVEELLKNNLLLFCNYNRQGL